MSRPNMTNGIVTILVSVGAFVSLLATVRAENRSFDGSGNNLAHPSLGETGQAFNRVASTAYNDGISQPGGVGLPSAREISNLVGNQTRFDGNRLRLSGYVYAFGQFLNHDLQRTALGGESFPILAPPGDPTFRGGSRAFPRSLAAVGSGTASMNPRQQVNLNTAFLDGSNVYGSDGERALGLRVNAGGQPGAHLLDSGSQHLLPRNTVGLENDDGGFGTAPANFFVAGDIRSNENLALASMHTLFMREHNWWVDELAAQNPMWSDEELYQRARKIVGAELQVITYQEFLPALLGPHATSAHGTYDPSIDPTVLNEFATVAFRVGHSTLPVNFRRAQDDGSRASGDPIRLGTTEFQVTGVLNSSDAFDWQLKGLSLELQEEVDTMIVDGLRNIVGPQIDIFAFDIQRGRDHGTADYNTMRASYGLPRVTTFADITSDAALQSSLEQIYGDVNSIDAFVGVLAEDHLPGASVGPLTTAVINEQFRRTRDGDRFWYENDADFSAAEVDMLQSTRLADVILRNTGLTRLQDNVFFLPPIGDFDLSGLVDADDRAVLEQNWTGGRVRAALQLFTQGDADGDGDTDAADATLLVEHWSEAEPPGGQTSGAAAMNYDPATGGVSLDPRDTATGNIVAFYLSSDLDVIRAGNGFREQDALLPFAAGSTDTDLLPNQVAQVDWTLDGFSEVWDLGNILPQGLTAESLGDVILRSGYASGLGHGGTFRLEVLLETGSLPGDYNGNGLVEQGDLDLVLLNWGAELVDPVEAGWLNDLPMGPIDQGELDAVLLNWGSQSASIPAAGVPEPSTFVLLLVGLFGMWGMANLAHSTTMVGVDGARVLDVRSTRCRCMRLMAAYLGVLSTRKGPCLGGRS